MHLYFEKNEHARSDCSVLSLSWMGKVPDDSPDDSGWKLDRSNYYQEGWLASGNVRGVVGVTFTACHCRAPLDPPPRMNFNLRGHRSEMCRDMDSGYTRRRPNEEIRLSVDLAH
ncbi:PREDICTED: tubby-related protein 4-like [Priapulus caudatus]|uniref:Tubby-related protein 4-like n=1 Tax=Priapulus caudatus TaxID=37621 RepID=A0ABM1EX74_PRICU|nr:PREDICTED: tubby-related protein 4-like [Priapulus caudatus]